MSTPRIPPVSVDNPPIEVQETFTSLRAKRGKVPNLFRTLAIRPEVMQAYAALADQTVSTGVLPTALKELAVIRVSLINGCEY